MANITNVEKVPLLLKWLEVLMNGHVKADNCWQIVAKNGHHDGPNPCTNHTGTVRESSPYREQIDRVNNKLTQLLIDESTNS